MANLQHTSLTLHRVDNILIKFSWRRRDDGDPDGRIPLIASTALAHLANGGSRLLQIPCGMMSCVMLARWRATASLAEHSQRRIQDMDSHMGLTRGSCNVVC